MGAATLKAGLSPKVRSLVQGMESKPVSEECRVRQVLEDNGMKGFEGEEEEFVVDAELDREPVEMDKGGGDVLPGHGVCDDSDS